MKTLIHIPNLRFPGFKGEWELKRFGTVISRISKPVKVEKQRLYQQIGIRSHGKGLFHKELVDGNELGNKRVFWIVENALVVNIVFAWEQAVAKTTSKEIGMIASHRFPMYKPLNDLSNVDYLLHFFLTKKGKTLLELASPGGAGRNKTLGQKEFENLKFHIPVNEEQTRIANFLSTIDKKIASLQKKKFLLEQYKKGVMQKIFTQELRFKDENGRPFPEWHDLPIEQIGTTFNGLSGKTKEDFGAGKPYIQYKQVFDCSEIDILNFGSVMVNESENQNKVQYGDVLFTVSSETIDEIGMSSVLLSDIDELYLNSFCFGFRPFPLDVFVPQFSKFLFRSEKLRKEIIKLAQGSTRYNMSKVQFLKINVSIPSKNEQIKIANFLSTIDDKINRTEIQLNQTHQWKKGLLQNMFC